MSHNRPKQSFSIGWSRAYRDAYEGTDTAKRLANMASDGPHIAGYRAGAERSKSHDTFSAEDVAAAWEKYVAQDPPAAVVKYVIVSCPDAPDKIPYHGKRCEVIGKGVDDGLLMVRAPNGMVKYFPESACQPDE